MADTSSARNLFEAGDLRSDVCLLFSLPEYLHLHLQLQHPTAKILYLVLQFFHQVMGNS
jgi:hypothetical protein